MKFSQAFYNYFLQLPCPKSMRLGQYFIYFCSQVLLVNILDPELFYCKNPNKAKELILTKYIES